MGRDGPRHDRGCSTASLASGVAAYHRPPRFHDYARLQRREAFGALLRQPRPAELLAAGCWSPDACCLVRAGEGRAVRVAEEEDRHVEPAPHLLQRVAYWGMLELATSNNRSAFSQWPILSSCPNLQVALQTGRRSTVCLWEQGTEREVRRVAPGNNREQRGGATRVNA